MTALRPPVADRLLAAASFVLSLVAAIVMDAADLDVERSLDVWGVALLAAMAALLLARRRWPMGVLLGVVALSVPYHIVDYPHEAALPAVLVAVFSVALHSRLPIKVVAAGVALVVVIGVSTADEASDIPADVFIGIGWLLAALLAGLALRFHRNWRTAVTERMEQERAGEVERRLAEERVLIAAELHDVLAHGLAVANVQASVAAHLIDQLPTRDEPSLRELSRALQNLSESSRATLHELRGILDVLHGGNAESTEPAPHLGEMQRLVEMAEAAEVRVEVEADGLPDELPSTVSVVAYRIIQESLTNVIRHSTAKQATVRLDQDGHRLRIAVVDHGPARPSSPVTSAGFGIVGMAGRAQAVGGELSAGPGESGGFEVRASLPLPEIWRVPS